MLGIPPKSEVAKTSLSSSIISQASSQKEMGMVLVATGGFAGDTSPASLMAKWAPQLLQMPTTSTSTA